MAWIKKVGFITHSEKQLWLIHLADPYAHNVMKFVFLF